MQRSEIETGISKVLSKISLVGHENIKPTDKLKIYVPPQAVLIFALRVDQEFPNVDLTDLTNSLYDPLATVNDLVGYIYDVYNP